MKFLCVVLVDETLAAAMTPEDWAEMDRVSQDYDQSLMTRGVFVAAEALYGRETARTVRVRAGDAMVTDGPFMEAKETLAGFILVDVASFDAAVEIAKGIPMARLGAVEVRQAMVF